MASSDDRDDADSPDQPDQPDPNTIRVNFGRPMPIFPLNVVTLMPHAVLPIHIFEPRYRQMVADALDGPGQIAMAIFRGDNWKTDYEGTPPVREAVCVGQIVQHNQLPDDRYHLALHGVCRARIIEEFPPDDGVLYRRAMLEPIGLSDIDEDSLADDRERLRKMLTETRLRDMTEAKSVLEYLDSSEVPTSAVFELVSFTLLSDNELRYRLLAEPDVRRRAGIIKRDLESLCALLERAAPQLDHDPPKGVCYN